jgi:protein-serine/threonine kinase
MTSKAKSRTETVVGSSGTVAVEGQAQVLAKGASMKYRISRLFSPKSVSKASIDRPTQVIQPSPSATSQDGSPHATPAHPTDRASSIASTLRFVRNPNAQGEHEHHLKSIMRRKLFDMWPSVLGKNHNPVSDLVEPTWSDELRRENESLTAKRIGGPTSSANLVEKYGKCREVVGRGAYGTVRISHRKTGQEIGETLFAIKEFRPQPTETSKQHRKRIISEYCVASALRHPNIIHTMDLLQDVKGRYCQVMEFCAGGDLCTLILSAGKLEAIEAGCYFKQMMRGVEYLHEMGIAHRDLKPENMLLTTSGAVKIIDFGNGQSFRLAWEKEVRMISGLHGTAPYIAPEVFGPEDFDARAADVWSCGIIYMAMRTGRHFWRVAMEGEDVFYDRYLDAIYGEGFEPIESLEEVSPSLPIPKTSKL